MKPIKLKDDTYWQLREMRDKRANRKPPQLCVLD
jgi:hypothetical protein